MLADCWRFVARFVGGLWAVWFLILPILGPFWLAVWPAGFWVCFGSARFDPAILRPCFAWIFCAWVESKKRSQELFCVGG